MVDHIVQLVILIMGAMTVALISFPDRRHYWGLVIGFLSEPFWLYATWKDGQWGIFILSFWYAYFYGIGWLRYHMKKES